MANVVTNVGKAIVAKRMLSATPAQAEPKYVGWGTGAGVAAVGDTTLFSEAAEARIAGTATTVTTTLTNDTHQVVATLTSASTQTITNAGLFDAATVGNLYVKGDFPGIALTSTQSIQFTFQIQFV